MYYAIEYPYGRNVINHGQRANLLVRFRWAATRDDWLAKAPRQGERVEAPSRHHYVRLAQRHPEGWLSTGDGLEIGDGVEYYPVND
jgi:hypothetical protein